MSKHSSRRLAVVAGAALALGSMAPALAATVNGNVNATVSADPNVEPGDVPAPTLPDVEDILADVEGLRAEVEGIAALASARVAALSTAANADAAAILGSLEDLGLLGDPSGLVTIKADVNPLEAVNVGVGFGGATDRALGAVAMVNGVLADPNAAVDAVLDLGTVQEAQDTVDIVAGVATGAVAGVDVDALRSTVLGLADTGGLLNGGLEDLVGFSGGVTVNVLASLLASF